MLPHEKKEFALCSTCFEVRYTKVDTRLQRCKCQGRYSLEQLGDIDCPNGLTLCQVCARRLVGGFSRYSWLACESCKTANKKFHFRMGFNLPLGRHSVMNGVAIPANVPREELEKRISAMMTLTKSWEDLATWCTLKTRSLFESVPEWAEMKLIPIDLWEKKFESSLETSLNSFAEFYGVKDAKELRKRLKEDRIHG